MWRSAKVLFDTGVIEAPDSLRALIEAVYGREAPSIPPALEAEALRADGDETGAKTLGTINTIRLADGYGALGDLPKDQEIGTRLGEEVAVLRLARQVDGALVPWAEGEQAWARSEIRVRAKWLRALKPPPGLRLAEQTVRKGWPDWDTSVIGVVVEGGGILLESETAATLHYDPGLGLLRRQK